MSSKLSANAKPFKFNPKVRSFVPKKKSEPEESKDEIPGAKPEQTQPAPGQTETKTAEEPAESWEDAPVEEQPKVQPEVEEKKKTETQSTPSVAQKAAEEAPAPTQKTSSKKSSKKKSEPSSTDSKVEALNKTGVKLPEGFKPHDERPHANVVFIGHVDAGKSTLSGQILLLTGQVDTRTIEKYEREAKDKNRESWYLAFIMDTNEEERAKGKTVEVGRAHFETKKKRYTLLDAPGHKNYVPNMISGAAQADIGVLIISARKSEFEAGFDRGGQTREHAMLAKTLGVSRLVVAINKMDESTVLWSKKRYDQIIKKLTPFLKKWFKPKDTVFLPVSAYTGANLLKPVDKSECDWYDGKCLLDILDNVRDSSRNDKAGLRIPVIDRHKEMGTVCSMGKVEAGTLYRGQKLLVMPTGAIGECTGILVNEQSVDVAKPGENVTIQLKGLDENELMSGFVLCERERPCNKCIAFEAQLRITELLSHKPLMTNGYRCILHCHTIVIECQIAKMLAIVDKKSGNVLEKKPRFAKKNQSVQVKIRVPQSIAVECYKDFSQLGRFTLRDEGKTIAIGKILVLKSMEKKK
mmetsp:Transcript_26300/g.36657  ORF Transcript_26300/g.36657 Transcript_26300/m.36657 type:complete len:580 (-) Transcript_26300:215-1954(-)